MTDQIKLGPGPVRVRMTRDSVCAADDIDEHLDVLEMVGGQTWPAFIQSLWVRSNLPSIAGGKATWVLVSARPLTVVAQQWRTPRLLGVDAASDGALRTQDGVLCVHWDYETQKDPERVWEALLRETEAPYHGSGGAWRVRR